MNTPPIIQAGYATVSKSFSAYLFTWAILIVTANCKFLVLGWPDFYQIITYIAIFHVKTL